MPRGRARLVAVLGGGLLAAAATAVSVRPAPPTREVPETASRPHLDARPQVPRPHLPAVVRKQAPDVARFGDCPADGDTARPGQDGAENHLKNRVDEPTQYIAVTPGALLELPSYPRAHRHARAHWPAMTRRAIEAHEGIAVRVEGYLPVEERVRGVWQEGGEATNCGFTSPEFADWHAWLVADSAGTRASRAHAVVAEFTPRVRARHLAWTLAKVQAAASRHLRVRLGGWTLYDPEHPEQLGRTRGTLWEIHPVTAMDIRVGRRWVPLDDWEP